MEIFFRKIQYRLRRDGMQVAARMEQRIAVIRSETVPRTDLLADITAKYPVTKIGRQVGRDVSRPVLNGVVTDAAVGIEYIWLRESICRAGIETADARSAMVSGKRFIVG